MKLDYDFQCAIQLISLYSFVTELFAKMTGVKNFWGRDKGICRAWLAYDPYIYLTEASKVEVIFIVSLLIASHKFDGKRSVTN